MTMKKRVLSIFLCGLTVFSFTSCEDYFDDVPENATSLEDVFSNRGQTLRWLSNVYYYIPDNRRMRWSDGLSYCWRTASNEGYLPWDTGTVPLSDVILGTMYPSTDFVKNLWTEGYRAIQYANIYLANVDKCSMLTDEEKEWTKAECRVLRAYYYFYLMKCYGPVPIVGDRVYGVADPLGDMMLPRKTVDECFEYIITEIKNAINGGHLISQFNSSGEFDTQFRGNMTEEAAQAILAEVYLFRASYIFNGDPYYQTLKNNDGTLLFPQSRDNSKWEDARDAALAIINSGKYQLEYRNLAGEQVTDVKQSCPYQSSRYASLGLNTNREMIFYRSRYSADDYPMRPRHTGIDNAQTGGGAFSVPLQFVDLYFTNKGLRIEDDPDYFTYDTENPTKENVRTMLSTTAYKDKFSGYTYFTPGSGYSVMKQFYNREPRFYLGITFQNRRWDFDNSRTYYTVMSFNGNSGPTGNTHDYPIFGTIGRKPLSEGTTPSGVDNAVIIRLGEVYLNYAEACCELGDLATAIHYVNLIRSRAGVAEYVGLNSEDQTARDARGETRIDLGNLTQDLVRKVIYRERIIELAFENKYYFDVRRWGVADMAQGDGWIYPTWHKGGEGGQMVGFNVSNTGTAEEQTNVQMNFYKRVQTQTRVFTKRMSFLPIPQEEVNRDLEIVQNTGWETETDEE